jgi:hypothetical protein
MRMLEQLRSPINVYAGHPPASTKDPSYEGLREELRKYVGRAVPSGATINPELDDPEARLRRILGVEPGEELISIAVRKADGSIETRSA